MMTELRLAGLHASLTIHRDSFGVAHVRAENEHDAWFGQAFVAALDRLWQLEYDRRRATGRWSEVVGRAALAGDTLARRMQLGRSAQADVAAMSAPTRAMFEAYAAGVNAYLQSGLPLPPEYAAAGITPEPWEPWHSCALFKIRHVLMGVWPQKLAQAQLLARIGPDAYARLDGRPPIGSAVILPPDGAVKRTFEAGAEELREAARQLGFLDSLEGGSNSWAVHGGRTTTGKPVLCNDSHRALDVPSVYWQVHITCPDFDAIGATFPGMPGFPHFGHNGHVAWNITHACGDYQDLYIEQFDRERPGHYQTPAGWAEAQLWTERIMVAPDKTPDQPNGERRHEEVPVELWRTRHGPIVHGDPRDGLALALRYTATEEPNRAWECLRPMLGVRTVAELHETQREWVDPANNLVSADIEGNIGYLTRGYLPIRSSEAHRQFPAPGWTGENEWVGRVAFERLPQEINPAAGYIVTANQQIIPGDDPYIAHDFSSPARAERIYELARGADRDVNTDPFTPQEIASWQADVTSRPARAWVSLLQRVGPYTGEAERARAMLVTFDGALLAESAAALLYSFFRREIARGIFEPVMGAAAWIWLTGSDDTTLHAIITRCMANVVDTLDKANGATDSQNGQSWNALLPVALAAAWRRTMQAAGPDPTLWSWSDHHQTNAKHPMALCFPQHAQAEGWTPPRVPVGGDGDTVQVGSYLWRDTPDFPLVSLSVYRQVVDLSRIEHASFVIPGGVSGVPSSPHYQDQLEAWRTRTRIPMHYAPEAVNDAAVETVTLRPV